MEASRRVEGVPVESGPSEKSDAQVENGGRKGSNAGVGRLDCKGIGRGAVKGATKGRGKSAGRGGSMLRDVCAPCGYFVAGYCRHGRQCDLRHSLPFALAVRHEWLHAEEPSARKQLRAEAAKAFGSEEAVILAGLFPRAFSSRIRCTLAMPCEPDSEDDGFAWECPTDRSGADLAAVEVACAPNAPSDSLTTSSAPLEKVRLRHLLVLDLEGKEEIIEFPIIAIDVAERREVGRFQRFVRPHLFFEGESLTPDSPAAPFPEVLREFDDWLQSALGHGLFDMPATTAFLTCGDWDCKHVHSQCKISRVPVPAAFGRWVNIKRSYADYFGGDFSGMKSMLAQIGQLDAKGNPRHGFHHLGMHDVENICRCVLHILQSGAFLVVNGWKKPEV